MLLQALHDYATSRRLLDDLPLQRRVLHALIPLDAAGRLRLPHLSPSRNRTIAAKRSLVGTTCCRDFPARTTVAKRTSLPKARSPFRPRQKDGRANSGAGCS